MLGCLILLLAIAKLVRKNALCRDSAAIGAVLRESLWLQNDNVLTRRWEPGNSPLAEAFLSLFFTGDSFAVGSNWVEMTIAINLQPSASVRTSVLIQGEVPIEKANMCLWVICDKKNIRLGKSAANINMDISISGIFNSPCGFCCKKYH